MLFVTTNTPCYWDHKIHCHSLPILVSIFQFCQGHGIQCSPLLVNTTNIWPIWLHRHNIEWKRGMKCHQASKKWFLCDRKWYVHADCNCTNEITPVALRKDCLTVRKSHRIQPLVINEDFKLDNSVLHLQSTYANVRLGVRYHNSLRFGRIQVWCFRLKELHWRNYRFVSCFMIM